MAGVADWIGTLFGTGNPGYANVASFDTIDLAVQASSDIDGNASSDLNGPTA